MRLFDWRRAGGSSGPFLDPYIHVLDQWAPAAPPAPQLP